MTREQFEKIQELQERIRETDYVVKELKDDVIPKAICECTWKATNDGYTRIVTLDKEAKQLLVNHYESKLKELQKQFEEL